MYALSSNSGKAPCNETSIFAMLYVVSTGLQSMQYYLLDYIELKDGYGFYLFPSF